MRVAHDIARIIDRDNLNAFARHALNESLPMRRIRAEDLHALDWANRTDRPTARQSLLSGAEEAEHRRIRTGGLGDRKRAGRAHAQTREIGLMHEGERLARRQ